MSVDNFAKYVKNTSNNFQEVLTVCQNLLYEPIAQDAKKYLDERVSLYNQKKFGFGYFPDDDNINLLLSKVDREKLLSLKLLWKKYVPDGEVVTILDCGTLAHHNIIMPYKDMYGNIIALVGRTIYSDEERKRLGQPKYKTTNFIKSVQLFGLDVAKKSIIKKNNVIIVEGQIDCITAHQYGIFNVVALGGVVLTSYQLAMIMRYTENIILALDNDEEGQGSTKKIIAQYGHLVNIKTISIPSGYKDLDDALRKSSNSYFLDI